MTEAVDQWEAAAESVLCTLRRAMMHLNDDQRAGLVRRMQDDAVRRRKHGDFGAARMIEEWAQAMAL